MVYYRFFLYKKRVFFLGVFRFLGFYIQTDFIIVKQT